MSVSIPRSLLIVVRAGAFAAGAAQFAPAPVTYTAGLPAYAPAPRQPSPQPAQPADAFPGFPQLQAGNASAQLPMPAAQQSAAILQAHQPSHTVVAALRAALAQQQPQPQAGNAALLKPQPAASKASEDDYWADLQPDELPLKTVDRKKMDFSADQLKVKASSLHTLHLQHCRLTCFTLRCFSRSKSMRVIAWHWPCRGMVIVQLLCILLCAGIRRLSKEGGFQRM